MSTRESPLEIDASYTLTTREWVWTTARLRPWTLFYDTVAAALLLVLGVWEGDVAYLLVLWALSILVLMSYLWVPWLFGRASGRLGRATLPAELKIDATGITVQTAAGTAITEWSAVKRVIEVGRCLAVVRYSGQWRVIPKRAFSADQLAALRTYLEQDGLLDRRTLWAKIRKFANEGPDS